MKTRLFLTYTCSLICLLATLQSCSRENMDTPFYNDGYIHFAAPGVSRNIINSADQMTDFYVWAWYEASGTFTSVFNELTLSRSGRIWTPNYTGEEGKKPQYWKFNTPYHFYAISGYSTGNADIDSEGTITVKAETGDTDKDLLTACRKDISYTPEEDPQPVSFHFQHEKAKVSVKLSAASSLTVAAQVTQVLLSGASLSGTLIYQTNLPESQSRRWTYDDPQDYNGKLQSLSGGTSYFSIQDLLLPPQALGNTIKLTIGFSVNGKPQEKTFNLNGYSSNWWSRGEGYIYSFTLREDGIYFEGLTQDNWEESHSGGDINIGA